jgi:4-alpha-glucanotransferase
MNIPGTTEGNWSWRLNKDDLKIEIMEKVRTLNSEYQRN